MPKQIVIIRHGEKTKDPNNFGLSQKGFARSLYLVDYLKNNEMFSTPDKIYCFNTHNGVNRSKQLIQPFIDKYTIPCDYQFSDDEKGTTALVKDIMSSENDNYNILICWEHNTIPFLIQQISSKFRDFKYWSNDPKHKKTDDDNYTLTVVINNDKLLCTNQSDDFDKDNRKLKHLKKQEVVFKI
jgi:hypothetical protein